MRVLVRFGRWRSLVATREEQEMADETSDGGGVTRLSFIKTSAGVAAGAAAIGVPAVLSGEKPGVVATASSPTPREPVMAYVRNADLGEVTVMSGTGETTYRDHALVRRLLAAAPQDSIVNGGGIDVVAP
jgi:hypothetical protein